MLSSGRADGSAQPRASPGSASYKDTSLSFRISCKLVLQISSYERGLRNQLAHGRKTNIHFNTDNNGAREMGQWLRALASFQKPQVRFPVPADGSQPSVSPVQVDQVPSFGLCDTRHIVVHSYIYGQNTYMHNLKIKQI